MQKNTNMATRSKTKNEKKNNSSMRTEDEVEYKVNTTEKPLEHRRVITRQNSITMLSHIKTHNRQRQHFQKHVWHPYGNFSVQKNIFNK